MVLRSYIFTVLCLLQLNAVAQDYTNVGFTIASGLPDNNVTCMLTDKQGFIWVGTSNGLCRFDGTHFYTLPKGIIESNKIAGDIILDLEEDGDYIWAAHRFGLSRINKYSFECTNFQNDELGPRYTNRRAIRDIYKDSVGNIWLAGDHQLLQYNRKSNYLHTVIDLEKILPPGRSKQVSKIIPDGHNRLMLFLVKGWLKYDTYENVIDTQEIRSIPVKLLRGQNLRLRSYWNTFLSTLYVAFNKETKSIAISNNSTPNAVGRATNLYVDSNLNILISQEQNLLTTLTGDKPVLLQETNKYYSLSKWTEPFNFIHYSNDIPCWGSIKGLHVVDSHLKYLRRYFLKNDDKNLLTTFPDILDVNEYSNNEWLIATKGGLYLMDKSTNKVSSFIRWQDSTIYKILLLPDKTIWLSTNSSLWHFNPKKQSAEKPITLESYAVSIIQLNNKLQVSTRSDGLLIVDLTTRHFIKLKNTDNNRQISSNRITAIKPLAGAGNFIITYNNLPGHYSYNNFEAGVYKPDSIPIESFALHEKFSIESVLPGVKQLWFGTYLGGVHLFDSVSNSWRNFTTKDGLGNNTVFEIINDKQNRIWLLTDNGIDVFDNRSSQVYNFPIKLLTGGKKGGFLNSIGNLIFYDNKNIIEIDPTAFDLNTANKNILLGQIFQGDKQFSLLKYSLNLPYDNNSFAISFSLQKLDPSVITKYAYRLSLHDNWKEIGTETQLNFASLSAGSYKLEIKATDEFGLWKYYSVPFPIIINPPLWKNGWFLIFVGFCFFILIRYLVLRRQKRRIKTLQQENEIIKLRADKEKSIASERERIITDLHDDVGATLSSMHIYGDLAKSVWDTQPQESKKMVDKISTTSKNLMNRMGDIIWSMKPADEEKHSFTTRLKNYSNELLAAKNIECHFEIDEIISRQIIQPETRKSILLIAKEAMNNIAKYSKASTAVVSLQQQKEIIRLVITDNGTGFDITNTNQGNGLQNIQQRCKQLNGSCNLQSIPGEGTSIACSFPIAIISHI